METLLIANQVPGNNTMGVMQIQNILYLCVTVQKSSRMKEVATVMSRVQK